MEERQYINTEISALNVLLIHGQSHKGSTYHIGRILAEEFDGAKITEFFLPRDLNHFCLGCYRCLDDETKCPFWAEKEPIMKAMEQADLLIFTTPNYCFAPSAPMKAFIDLFFDIWMAHRPKDWMFGKKAVVISTTAGAGARAAIKPVKNTLFNWGVPYIQTYGIAVQAMNWEMVKDDKKAKIEKDMSHLAKKISRIGTPKVGISTRFLFKLMAGMHSSGWDSSPVEKPYWEERGWIGSQRPWKNK